MEYPIAWRSPWSVAGFTRRQRFAAVSLLSAVAMASFILLGWQWWTLLTAGLAIAGFVWAIEGDLKGEEWVFLPWPLVTVTVAVYGWILFWSSHWLMTVIAAAVYGVGLYGLMLILNVLNLSRSKPIPLARSASSALSVGLMAVSFALFYVWLWWQPTMEWWLMGVMIITVAVAWPQLWMGVGGTGAWWRSGLWVLLVCWLQLELAAMIGMWPRSFMSSLYLSGMLYLILGVVHYQEKRQQNSLWQRQYLLIGLGLLVGLYGVTRWYGGG